jgi:aminoglycoside 6'-N-acetyltransferase
VLDYLFGQRAKHRVIATCDARNDASARLLMRIGMRREGHLHEATWAKGEWTDDLLFAVLRREWTEPQRG